MTEQVNKFYALYGETIAKEGIAPVPTALFRYQKELGLSFQELALVCHLLSYRWTANNPHPSIETLSKITGISAKTIHQYKNSLMQNGNLKVRNRFSRTGGQLTNEYDLTPLFAKLQILIEKDVQTQELPASDDGCADSAYPPVRAEGGCEDSTHPPVKGVKNLQGGCEESTYPPVKNLHTPCEDVVIGGVNPCSHEVNNIQIKKYSSTAKSITEGNNVTLSDSIETDDDSATGDSTFDDSFVLNDIFPAPLEESPLRRHIKRFLDNKGAPNLSGGTAEETETEEDKETAKSCSAQLRSLVSETAVAEGIEDLALEIVGMRDLGMFGGTIPEKELARLFFARCRWNYKPLQEGEEPRAGPKKQMTRELALAMGCIHDPENNRIIVTPEALENLRRARAAGEI